MFSKKPQCILKIVKIICLNLHLQFVAKCKMQQLSVWSVSISETIWILWCFIHKYDKNKYGTSKQICKQLHIWPFILTGAFVIWYVKSALQPRHTFTTQRVVNHWQWQVIHCTCTFITFTCHFVDYDGWPIEKESWKVHILSRKNLHHL